MGKKWSPETKARVAAMRKARQNKQSTNTSDEISPEVFAYILGSIEKEIKLYAESANISASALASGLGKILQSKSKRQILGS